MLRVRPGESVPADGRVISGTTCIDQSLITGESVSVDRTVGDEVFGGTVNQFGTFDMVAERDGNDCSIQRMARLVSSADAGKSKAVSLADRWATWIVMLIIVIAGSTYIITSDIVRTVAVLVVFCPCAFILATPTAIVAAIGNASRHGFLVRDGGSLERLARVSRIIFDKTGTLTYGRLEVVSVVPADNISKKELYALAASAESGSEHPIAKAIVSGYGKKWDDMPRPSDCTSVPGLGFTASVSGRKVVIGNMRMMEANDISVPRIESVPSTAVYVACDGRYAGYIGLSDTSRESAGQAVSKMKELSVEPVLATGDSEAPAIAVADSVGIGEVHHGCLPEDKLALVKKYSSEGGVCMVGDGINDAPSLKAADVGISMGGIGSDIAIEASDIVAVSDSIDRIPKLIELSRRMMSKIRFNIAVALVINVIAVSLAVAGMLSPVAAALVHNAGSVFVVANSALILGFGWSDRSGRNRGPSQLIRRFPSAVYEEAEPSK